MAMVMPYRQVEVEPALQHIFEEWQDHPIAIQWVESLEWSAQSRRQAKVGGVYPHGVQLLLEGESGNGPIPYWLSWIRVMAETRVTAIEREVPGTQEGTRRGALGIRIHG